MTGTGLRSALRALRDCGLGIQAEGPSLEAQRTAEEPARIERATPLEGAAIAARRVPGAPAVGFAAFLDGIQHSRVVAHHGLVPLVHGSVAAAVRRRVDRRPQVWEGARSEQALFLPKALVDPALLARLAARIAVVDTRAEPQGAVHPQELAALAVTAVQRQREAAELALLAAWVERGNGPLLVDGGISASEPGARSDLAVGVIKSHRTLYADERSLPLVLGLGEGERTTAVTLSSPRRHPVASWYLRLRDPHGRAPLFGLVRIEVALTPGITARADEVSRWLLAERTPVALPDARWDVMAYGIRECEQYLSALLR